jgi:LysM repeat protein
LKKVFLSVTGIALIALLLAALGGVVLASGEKPVPVDVIEVQVSDDLAEIVIEPSADVIEETPVVVNTVQEEIAEEAVELPVAENPSDEDPEGEDHDEGGCSGGGRYANPEKFAAKIDAAAEFLGMTPEEIAAQVQVGKRLYEIAVERGVDVDAFKEAIHAVVNENGECGCGSH